MAAEVDDEAVLGGSVAHDRGQAGAQVLKGRRLPGAVVVEEEVLGARFPGGVEQGVGEALAVGGTEAQVRQMRVVVVVDADEHQP
jgi:hypothetical protein